MGSADLRVLDAGQLRQDAGDVLEARTRRRQRIDDRRCWDAAATCYSFNLNIALAAELVSYLAYLANCR